MRNILLYILVLLSIAAFACDDAKTEPEAIDAASNRRQQPSANLAADMKAVEPFFEPMAEPEQGEWLSVYREQGQTFDEYLAEDPTKVPADKRTIYIVPLGKFNAAENRIVRAATEYIAAFYGIPVKSLPTRIFPAKLEQDDFRLIDYPKHRQIRTGYILDEILKPALPQDAAALIALTNEDLYPDSSMSFVFGQASFADRVGVWSLYRLDDLGANYDTFLQRTLKIAVHETGHMFRIRHCTKYECVMSGTNHLKETDSRPIDACPECMAKIAWFTGISPADRYKRLHDYCNRSGMKVDAEEFRKKLLAVSGN